MVIYDNYSKPQFVDKYCIENNKLYAFHLKNTIVRHDLPWLIHGKPYFNTMKQSYFSMNNSKLKSINDNNDIKNNKNKTKKAP